MCYIIVTRSIDLVIYSNKYVVLYNDNYVIQTLQHSAHLRVKDVLATSICENYNCVLYRVFFLNSE